MSAHRRWPVSIVLLAVIVPSAVLACPLRNRTTIRESRLHEGRYEVLDKLGRRVGEVRPDPTDPDGLIVTDKLGRVDKQIKPDTLRPGELEIFDQGRRVGRVKDDTTRPGQRYIEGPDGRRFGEITKDPIRPRELDVRYR